MKSHFDMKTFRLALANAGLSQAALARRFKVSRVHLFHVLKGQRTNERLSAAIRRFVDANLRAIKNSKICSGAEQVAETLERR